MADFPAIRAGLATAVEAADEILAVYSPTPDAVGVVPCAIVTPGEPVALYHRTSSGKSSGLTQFNFDVIVLANRFGNQHGQTEIDGFLSTDSGSVMASIEADQTLGGVASVVLVTEAGDYGQIQVGDTDYVGCRFIVEVSAT